MPGKYLLLRSRQLVARCLCYCATFVAFYLFLGASSPAAVPEKVVEEVTSLTRFFDRLERLRI
jgi:hypothetical protein